MSRSFGARLRAARERKGIALDAIAQNTKINAALFDALERGDASRWPSGIFRRAFIRAYANAVGLDPEATVKEFQEIFPDPFDGPASALERGESAETPAELPEAGPLRLTLDDDPRRSINAAVDTLLGRWVRACAAVCDLAIVIGIAAAVFAAAGRFWTTFTIATVCYYFGGVLVIGNSPGAWLLAVRRARRSPQEHMTQPTTLPAVVATSDAAESVERFTTRRYPKAV